MKKNYLVFCATITLSIICVFIFTVGSAQAYSIYSITSSTAASQNSTNYNFNSSLENLLSPFNQFIYSLKLNTDISINASSNNNFKPNVSVNFDYQYYVNGFENWFYKTTGIQITGVITWIEHFFLWIFWWANRVVEWIVGWFQK